MKRILISQSKPGDVGRHFDVSQLKIGNNKIIINYEKNLQKTIPSLKEGLLKASKLLKIGNDMIIVVSSTKDEFVKNKMGGITGYTPNAYTSFLTINANSKWKKFIIGTVAHEFNHAIRFQRIKLPRRLALLDSLVLEGLAQCFEEDSIGTIRPWSKAITRAQAKRIWTNLKEKLDIRSRDLNDRVFLSPDDKEFPHWSGYTIAYLILRKKLKRLKMTDWNKIMDIDSELIVKDGL